MLPNQKVNLKMRKKDCSKMNFDMISELPEPLKFHILSYLPTKCAVRTCILSKSWRDVWTGLTCFVLDGSSVASSLSSEDMFRLYSSRDDAIIAKRELVVQKTKEFYDFLSRFCGSITKLDELDLCLYNVTMMEELHLDYWIDRVVGFNVKKLKLQVQLACGFRYALPKSVLSCKSITSLSLSKFVMNLSSLTDTQLPSLRELSLRNQVFLQETVLERLLANCMNLQSLILIDCYGLDELNIFGLSKLERVQLVDVKDLEAIEIDAPNLLEFRYEDERCTSGQCCDIEFSCCKNMKRLALSGVPFFDNDLSALLKTVPALEDLRIKKCNYLEHVEIICQQLVSLTIIDCKKLVKVKVDTPNLQDFTYSGLHPMYFVCNLLKLRHASIYLKFAPSKERWYSEIVKFLSRLSQTEKLLLDFAHVETFLIPESVRTNSRPPLYGVKQLQVAGEMPPQRMVTKFIESLLWLAPCPESIFISFPKECSLNTSSHKLLKFMYEKPLKTNCGCWYFLPVHCWRHSLNEVLLETQERDKSNTTDPSLSMGETLLEDNDNDIDAKLAEFFQRPRLDGKTVSFVKVSKPKVEWR